MILHIAIGLLLAVIGQTSGLEKMAESCDASICRLPTCYCGGTAVRNKCGIICQPCFRLRTAAGRG